MKYFLLTLLAALIIIQFFRIDKSVPEYNKTQDFISQETPPETVKHILKKACYDCHSNETVYPWYSEIAPVSWWLASHIEEGREHLNYSTWGEQPVKRKKHKLGEMIEEVEEGEMPLTSYTLAHSEASLTADEKAALINWLKQVNSSL
ncbi:heme-binding domain-containing protein [Fulvivirga sp. 29W222]|uniref:Heme-binding domain-containing protein n=1 Tax=Fulvivirga marina TaxID=2494733 RepID=A0A937FZ04_9BACT|nr:heme-binding domain-containing protein [Fulvivirga marina]MBL6448720.1 heme-binding domain-containing protein [Fulvivirga marina]